MSAAIHWEPVSFDPKRLSVGGPQRFMEIMKAAFDWPCTLHETDIPMLRAMSAVEVSKENPFTELADLLEKHHTIRLWEQY